VLNAYGNAIRPLVQGGTAIGTAIGQVQNLDSDGNGDTNLAEITFGPPSAQPGWTSGQNPLFDTGTGAAAGTVDPITIGVQPPLDPPVGNQPPVADANGPYTGTTAQAVTFDGSGSTDPDGTIVSYEWDFGDGSGTGTGATPTYTYGAAGTYADFPRVLTGDPNNGLDALGRETVLRDCDAAGNISKYYLEYFHDAQPRPEGNMPGTFNDQTSTLISDIEGNSMLYWNTPYDSALLDTDGSITGVPGKLVRAGDPGFPPYDGYDGPVVGNGDYMGATDNYANGWLNPWYIFNDPEHPTPAGPNFEGHNSTGTTLEIDKVRLGVVGHVEYPANVGAAVQPMGPTGSASPVILGQPTGAFDNVLTFSGDTGTVVYTQMKVLENLPVMLTSPRIWEALGLPLTPFEDSIGLFTEVPGSGPGSVDEDSIRPYVAMKAQLVDAICDNAGNCSPGSPVLGSNGQPIIGHGTAPIDIPNCERCHSVPAFQADGVTPNVNSPSYVRGGESFYGYALEEITNLEINYWKAYYPSLQTGTDWYARLKGAAVNMLVMQDLDKATGFLANYPSSGLNNARNPEPLVDLLGLPPSKQIAQKTRMGHESVICQKCHADNVIANVAHMG
jgi:hypothetical protein